MTELERQREHAKTLSTQRACPHCHQPISELDALCLVRGHGTRYYVPIRLPDGSKTLIREGDFNPQTMLWAGR